MTAASAANHRLRPRDFLSALCLAALTLALYAPVRHFQFMHFDDDGYVIDSRHVHAGLTWPSIRWALTTPSMSNWHPLTWMSYELDETLFHLNPGAMHFENAFIHALGSALLLLTLIKLTGGRGASFWTAAMFAWHPLHVESVAWISERKDVLSTLLLMACLLSYAFYVARPTWLLYLSVAFWLTLGLMAKPMLVSTPALLLLLDYWPLQRDRAMRPLPTRPYFQTSAAALIVEKLPLILIALASCALTYLVQSAGRSVASVNDLSLHARLINTVVSYARYLWMTVWPTKLAIFYPHYATYPAGRISQATLAASAAVLIAISGFAFVRRRSMPCLAVGWLWYLGVLLPTIGLVQAGRQALADRYAYVPLIGLFIALAWSAGHWARTWQRVILVRWLGGATLLSSALLARHQLGYWTDTETMMRHAIAVVPDNYLGHALLGRALDDQGSAMQAEAEYQLALQINAKEVNALFNLAVLEERQGDLNTALGLYQRQLAVDRSYVPLYNNLGNLLVALNRPDEALKIYRQGLAVDTDGLPQLAHNYALTLASVGRVQQAIPFWQRALEYDPDYTDAEFRLGQALNYLGKHDEGNAHLRRAEQLAPERLDIRAALRTAATMPARATSMPTE